MARKKQLAKLLAENASVETLYKFLLEEDEEVELGGGKIVDVDVSYPSPYDDFKDDMICFKFNSAQEDYLEEAGFRLHPYDGGVELETWTDGGVDMIINITDDDPRSGADQLAYYVDTFDIDEEIDIHRQDPSYRANFRITQSVQDFNDYIDFIEQVVEDLMRLE